MKITPLHDKSWFVKWGASLCLIIAITCRASGHQDWDIYLSLVGTSGWFLVGMWWHDRSLILLNGVAATILVAGIIN